MRQYSWLEQYTEVRNSLPIVLTLPVAADQIPMKSAMHADIVAGPYPFLCLMYDTFKSFSQEPVLPSSSCALHLR